MKSNPRSLLNSVGATTLSVVLLASCATHSPAKPDEAKIKQFAGQGYLSDEHYGITTSFAKWDHEQSSFEVALSVPTKLGRYPLVIYLPALGESRSAGEVWRTAWAEAGYAVISIQALAKDAGAWSSVQARAGDFLPLARERYSGKVMAERVQALQAALTELVRRQEQKEVPLDRIDLSHAAVVGYDLGAYTAMVIAGEKVRDAISVVLPIPISAVIALSPYADFSGYSFAERYADIRTPVLSVTSNTDTDALGMVTSAAVRKAPFEYMPSGEKYLLTLLDVSHPAMSGNGTVQETDRRLSPDQTTHDDNKRNDGRHKGGGYASANGHGRGEHSSVLGGTTQAIGVTAIRGITTAFLDVYLKNDPIAREWLEKGASRWVKGRGEIKKK